MAEIESIAELKKRVGDLEVLDVDLWMSAKPLILDLINSFEVGQQKPIERGKQALDFLKWLIREIEAEYPKSRMLLKDLETAKRTIEGFVKLEDDKKILGEGEGGGKGKGESRWVTQNVLIVGLEQHIGLMTLGLGCAKTQIVLNIKRHLRCIQSLEWRRRRGERRGWENDRA